MAFKLKSPFHVTQVEQSLKKGGIVGQGSSSGVVKGLSNVDIASVEGKQTVKSEPNNQTVDNLVKKADEGMPLGLNPKQEARFKTRKYKKGIRDDARFDRQTRKAEKIYERNQFEELQNLDEKGHIIPEGEKGAGTTWMNPDAAESEKIKRSEDAFDRKWKATEDYAKASQDAAAQDKRIQDKIAGKDVKSWGDPATKMLNMEKPNRAGTPVRMLRSVEDPTPMKYKSVRKAGRENLMSALAKQGEPIDYKKFESRIKSNSNFATPGTGFKATEPGKSNQPERVTVGDRAKESVKKAIKLGVLGPIKDNLYE